MAILCDYEEDRKPTKPFNAFFDSSNPLVFLEKVFDFVSRESDFFRTDSAVKNVNALVRAARAKAVAEGRKRKKNSEVDGKVDKRVKEEVKEENSVPAPGSAMAVKEETKKNPEKDETMTDTKEDKKTGRRGFIRES